MCFHLGRLNHLSWRLDGIDADATYAVRARAESVSHLATNSNGTVTTTSPARLIVTAWRIRVWFRW